MVKKIHRRVFRGVLKRRLSRVFVRRDYKDRLFVKLFHNKRELLTLYNLLNGTEYTDPEALLRQCTTLEGYSIFVSKVREYYGSRQTLEEAIDAACVYCIEHDILKEFLQKNRNEVARVLLAEYDAKKQRQMDIRDAREEGRMEGIRIFILDNQEEKVCRERILEKLQKRFKLDREQAERYFEQYSQEES